MSGVLLMEFRVASRRRTRQNARAGKKAKRKRERNEKSLQIFFFFSYADHKPDRNCHWVNGSCKPGKFCHNDRDKQAAAKLGLSYSDYAWRRRGHAVDAEYSRFHR